MIANNIVLEIIKEKYQYENERKRYYDNVISIPVSLLAFIVAGVYVIEGEHLQFIWFERYKLLFVNCILITTVVSMFFLFRVFFGLKRRYCSFPETDKVLKDYAQLEEYYNKINPNQNNQKDIENDFNETFVIQWYKDVNENNTKVNDTRANNFHSSKIFIGITYLLGILVFSLYSYSKINYPPMAKPKPQRVQTPPPPKPSPSPVRHEKGQGDKKLK